MNRQQQQLHAAHDPLAIAKAFGAVLVEQGESIAAEWTLALDGLTPAEIRQCFASRREDGRLIRYPSSFLEARQRLFPEAATSATPPAVPAPESALLVESLAALDRLGWLTVIEILGLGGMHSDADVRTALRANPGACAELLDHVATHNHHGDDEPVVVLDDEAPAAAGSGVH